MPVDETKLKEQNIRHDVIRLARDSNCYKWTKIGILTEEQI